MGISLILPTQGNPIALKRTLDSVSGIVDEIIVGSVCVFDEDEKIIQSYSDEYNLRVIKLPFNMIYHQGFAAVLNFIASHAKNNTCLYLNVGEIIEKGKGEILSKISPEYNYYYINHSVETHRWGRIWNKKELWWDGIIHEEIIGDHKPYHKPLFTFADTEKDMDNPFKAAIYNGLKECVYFNQYIKLVDFPKIKGITNEHWVKFSKDQYESLKARMAKKGNMVNALERGDLPMLLDYIATTPYFEKERFESSELINFQGARKDIL